MKCPDCKRKMNELKTFYYCKYKNCEFRYLKKEEELNQQLKQGKEDECVL